MSSLSSDDQWSERNKHLSKDNLHQMQESKFELFKSQDLESGCFNITFEIEGKLIYADKFTLVAVSETLAAMLSDRWTTKKDEPVKIDSHTYDDFYQLLSFIYSGCCRVTSENVFRLVDMAEFYAVECLKGFCDKFLSAMKKTPETIEEIYDFAVKYSLSGCMDSIEEFVSHSRSEMYKTENFLAYNKPFVQFLSTLDRGPDYENSKTYYRTNKNESGFFELVYQWAEHQVLKEKPTDDDGNFNLENAIKTELEPILLNIKFANMTVEFLLNFVVEKGFFLSSDEFDKFFANFRDRPHSDNEETLYKSVYQLVEKQAIQKQKIASKNGESFNLVNSIKVDLAKVITHVKFYEMDKQFLMDFVVAKGIITEEEASHVDDTQVVVENSNGEIISGVFKDIFGIREAIEKKVCYTRRANATKCRFTKFKFSIPNSPSTVTKMKGVDWYLCLESDGVLTFKHYSAIQKRDYLITEMKSKDEFQLGSVGLTILLAFYRNIDTS